MDPEARCREHVWHGERRPLPAGSSLSDGVFYWHPGPGFRGRYELVFERTDGTNLVVYVRIGQDPRQTTKIDHLPHFTH